jgi:uncharacterized protein YbjT (DUF2867 family)
MILVTGGTGTSGIPIVQALLYRGERVRVLARDPAKAARLLGEEVEIARGDLNDVASVESALEDVDRALLNSAPSLDLVQLQSNFVDAARRGGVKHVVKFSAMGANPNDPRAFARLHGKAEQRLKDSGLGWTMLRPPFFMQNLLGLAEMIKGGTIYQPTGNGRAGFVDVRDIGAVAAAVLAAPDEHNGEVYSPTGPELLGYADIAAAFTNALGRPVAYSDIPPEAAKAGMLEAGLPEWLADAINELSVGMRNGEFAEITDVVQSVGGREPTTLQDFIDENVDTFR